MKKRNRVFGLLITFMLLFLTACGGGNEDGKSAGNDEDVKVIKVWIHKAESDDEGKIYRALVDTFNDSGVKSADGESTLRIRLEYKGTPDTLAIAVSSEVLTGGLPDIFAVDAPSYAAYQSEGLIVPIGEYITDEQKNQYVDSVIAQSTIDGKLYGLSGMDAPAGLYYNKELINTDILSKAGILDYSTIDNPWNWNDVYNVLKVLKEEGKTCQIKLNLGFGGAEGCMYLYSTLVYSAGGTFSTGGKISGALDSQISLNGFRSLEQLLSSKGGESFVYAGENVDALAQGEVALEIYGPWSITSISKNYPDFKDKYDIMPMPVYEENGEIGSVATPCGSWGFAVTKDSKRTQDAAAVVAYLTGKEASLMFYQGIGTFPTNKELYSEISDFSEEGPLGSLAKLYIETARPRPAIPNYSKLAVAYSNIIEYIETMVDEPGYDLQKYVVDKAQAVDMGGGYEN